MATDTAPSGLARIDLGLLRVAAIGGLFGGLVLYLIMASYEATQVASPEWSCGSGRYWSGGSAAR